MIDSKKECGYSFTNKQFLLSPEAAILRSLAQSLYPDYLARMLREGKDVEPVSVPVLDEKFVRSSEAIWFRVLSETIYAEIILRQEKIRHTVVWFGSARLGTDNFRSEVHGLPDYMQQAVDLAEKFTKWSLEQGNNENPQPFVICTGAGPGIMQAGNLGAKKAGGRSIGLNIQLPHESGSNPYISKEISFSFQYFFTRKFHFLRRARAAVVFPGGFGSMDELFESLTLIQTEKMAPIKIILFGIKFWKEVVNMEKLVEYGTISKKDLSLFEYQDDVNLAFQSLTQELKNFL